MAKAVFFNKNAPLAEVEIEGKIITKIYRVIEEDRLPILLQGALSEESLSEWIFKRLIPEKRDGLPEVLARFSGRIFRYNNMFGLSDQYWFQFHETETWEKGNFFTNSYQEDFGKMFFLPWEADENKILLPTPDMTTNGVLKKRWIQEDGQSYLIKAGSKVYHQEPLSEVLASITLERIDLLPFVKYELVVSGLQLCSKCGNFVTQDTEFVPASYIYKKRPRKKSETVFEHLVDTCSDYGIENVEDYLNRMITADKIIGNDDRHLGNFGFIRSAETGEFLDFAPLFDSGSAYWSKPGVIKPQRLFAEQEMAALAYAMPDVNFDKVEQHDEMFRLIDMYPEIGKKKKMEIKQSIIESEQELENCRIKIEKTKAKKERSGIDR